jgi:hypothetical protein
MQEPRVAANVAHECLSLGLLAQIGIHVTAERARTALGVAIGVDTRQRAVCKGAFEIEVGLKFAREQRV